MADKKTDKKPYHEMVSEKLIEQLKAGTAPWQVPWEPGQHIMPHNPVSGTKYKGINAFWLTMQGRSDPRWMTYKQAKSVDAQVKKGEKGTLVEYWKFYDQVQKRDDNGKPMVDENGKKVMQTVQLDKPRVFTSVVFNAEQILGLPPLEVNKPVEAWERHERAEKILANSGVPIYHDQPNMAFYLPSKDTIHLPDRGQFPTADNYYATALHELGHSTGHPSRLNRDLSGSHGGKSYAIEELRAEISSMMVGDELGIGHDPGQHAAYVGSWIKVLEEDPREIFRAARDAEKIKDLVLSYEHEKVVVQGNEKTYEHSAEYEANVLAQLSYHNGIKQLDDEHKQFINDSWKEKTSDIGTAIDLAKSFDLPLTNEGLTYSVVSTFQHDRPNGEPVTFLFDGANPETKQVNYVFHTDESPVKHVIAANFHENKAEVIDTIDKESGKSLNADPDRFIQDVKNLPAATLARTGLDDAVSRHQTPEQSNAQSTNNALSLKLAEKVSQRFENEADRQRFMQRVEQRLAQDPNQAAATNVKVKETVKAKQEADIEL